jgi:hypothetical protein
MDLKAWIDMKSNWFTVWQIAESSKTRHRSHQWSCLGRRNGDRLSLDFIAEEKGSMGLPEVNMGILFGWIHPTLARMVNRAVAMEIALSGNTRQSRGFEYRTCPPVFRIKELLRGRSPLPKG